MEVLHGQWLWVTHERPFACASSAARAKIPETMKASLLSILICLSGCVRAGFDQAPISFNDGGPRDSTLDGRSFDGQGPDAALDGAAPDGRIDGTALDMTADLRPDGPITRANCDPVALLQGDSQAARNEGPTLSADGLRLYAKRFSPLGRTVATRADLSSPFGTWTTTTAFATSIDADLDLFEHRGTSWGVQPEGSVPTRQLTLCPLSGALPATCAPLTIQGSADGAAFVDQDLDDPSAAVLGDRLLFFFNGQGSGLPQAIYQVDITTTQSLDSVPWNAAPVPGLQTAFTPPRLGEPALSQDGLLLVVMRKEDNITGTDGGNLYLFTRSAVDDAFGAPLSLDVASDPLYDEGDAEIWATADGMELYFTRTDSDTTPRQVYHSRCRLR